MNGSCFGPDPVGNLFVRTSGSDGNPGTREQPLRRIGTALVRASASNSIIVEEVTYIE